jgi:hypothetical protein
VANFTPSSPSDVIDPGTQPVTLQVGAYSVTVPAGSFHPVMNGAWFFMGIVNGVPLEIQIASMGIGRFQFLAGGYNVNFSGVTSPTTVMIAIGSESGSYSVPF